MRNLLAVLVIAIAFGSAVHAAPVALVGGTVIDGTGAPPLADAVILVEGERIQTVGRRSQVIIPPGTRSIDITGAWVLPGFIDLHTHFTMPGNGRGVDNSEAGRTLKALHYMNVYLRGGITAIRDTGSMPEVFQSLIGAQREGAISSIRLFSAGRLITTRGGHGAKLQGLAREATGPWDWRLAVRENFNAGFHHIKFAPPYTREEIAAGIDEAKTLGMRVTTHSGALTTTSMTRIAIEAGTQCIEHAGELTDEELDLMAAKGIHLVPTLTTLREFFRPGVMPPEIRKLVVTQSKHEDVFRKARTRKLVMGIGTDGTGRFNNRYTELYPTVIGAAPNWYFEEMKYFVELGASPLEAIVAATKNGAIILGEASRLGTLEPGKQADLQVIRKNPLQSFDALGNPELVMVGGRLYTF